jgi:hypothetical protein
MNDVLLQSIVFNFIEYLISTLCINLHLGYPVLDYCPISLPQHTTLVLRLRLLLCICTQPPMSSNPSPSLPKNQPKSLWHMILCIQPSALTRAI